jgi:hypothetical protein
MAPTLKKALVTGAAALLSTLIAQPQAWSAESHTSAVPLTDIQSPEPLAALTGLHTATGSVARPIEDLRLDPLAASAADPLANGIALQPDAPGNRPISTTDVTQPLSDGGGLSSIPLVAKATGLLPG